ncbi:helix-turn-helix domain-containing protein [Sphingobium boeckii]|uniref:CRP-like cAMP-binding protein n=1 Tax=Sphingobium boeckii TaxID=1082345 RepID=A0A7W9ECX2_9SPHN|nr:CRP-like cAMP-binding protein [Sphingobium boeckii]
MLTKDFLRDRHRSELTKDDIAALESSISEVKDYGARETLIRAGERVRQSTLLLEGLMCRYMDDRQGERQLVAVHVAGDFVDLHGFPLRRLDHDVATLTEVRLAFVPHGKLLEIVAERPNLTRILWFSTLIDAAMHREWIFRLGRLNAYGRIAHFFCEIDAKLQAVNRSDGHHFPLPINQNDLGEACGMTGVHVNRILRQLREEGVMTFRGGEVAILDRKRLERIAEFDPHYLYLDENDPDRN